MLQKGGNGIESTDTAKKDKGKKVSVITMHNYPNYGSILQAFAAQEKLKEFASEVEIIDYSGGSSTLGRSFFAYLALQFRLNPLKALLGLPIRLRKRMVYDRFAGRYLNLTAERYTTAEDFMKFPFHDGYYCTGSDQVWNPFFTENEPFFLNFVPDDKKKFGLSVSIGNYLEEKLNPDEADKIKKYVSRYEYISVREERGLKLLSGQLDYPDAIQLVDPTVAMPPEFWREFAPESRIKGEYILVYKLGKESAFEALSKEISKRTGLPLVRFCNQSFGQVISGAGKKVIMPRIFRLITLIDNAKYLITDSFHGTALAMNLNTEPVVYREEYDGERISGFLRMLGYEHRYLKSINDPDIIDIPVDFDHVNEVLARERVRVDEFLCKVFQVPSQDR